MRNYAYGTQKRVYETLTSTTVPKGFCVHHLNGIKHETTIDNLVMISEMLHRNYHKELIFAFTGEKPSYEPPERMRKIKELSFVLTEAIIERELCVCDVDRLAGTYGISELTAIFKTSRHTIASLIQDNKLKAFKVGRAWRVTQESLDEFMEV